MAKRHHMSEHEHRAHKIHGGHYEGHNPRRKQEMEVAGMFHEANVAELFRKVNYEPVNIESYLFHVRIPDESGYVQKDWEEGRYTKDEASFLNLLQITPKMLLELFGVSWKTSLANFIRGISTTSCYKDMNLITKGECQNVRYFLEKIHYWFKRHPSARLVKSSV